MDPLFNEFQSRVTEAGFPGQLDTKKLATAFDAPTPRLFSERILSWLKKLHTTSVALHEAGDESISIALQDMKFVLLAIRLLLQADVEYSLDGIAELLKTPGDVRDVILTSSHPIILKAALPYPQKCDAIAFYVDTFSLFTVYTQVMVNPKLKSLHGEASRRLAMLPIERRDGVSELIEFIAGSRDSGNTGSSTDDLDRVVKVLKHVPRDMSMAMYSEKLSSQLLNLYADTRYENLIHAANYIIPQLYSQRVAVVKPLIDSIVGMVKQPSTVDSALATLENLSSSPIHISEFDVLALDLWNSNKLEPLKEMIRNNFSLISLILRHPFAADSTENNLSIASGKAERLVELIHGLGRSLKSDLVVESLNMLLNDEALDRQLFYISLLQKLADGNIDKSKVVPVLKSVLEKAEKVDVSVLQVALFLITNTLKSEALELRPLVASIAAGPLASTVGTQAMLCLRSMENESDEKGKDAVTEILKLLSDESSPLRALGIYELQKATLNKKISIEEALQLMLNGIRDEDSFVYLNAIKGINALLNEFGFNSIVADLYADENQDIDVRLRLGEVLLNYCEVHPNLQIANMAIQIVYKETDLPMRISAMSILGSCATLAVGESVDVALKILTFDAEDPALRRSALFLLAKVVEQSYNVSATQRQAVYTRVGMCMDDPDDGVRAQAQELMNMMEMVDATST